MIFRFSLHRKKLDPCDICEQEMLKAISFVEIKILFWNIYIGLGHSYYITKSNSQSMG